MGKTRRINIFLVLAMALIAALSCFFGIFTLMENKKINASAETIDITESLILGDWGVPETESDLRYLWLNGYQGIPTNSYAEFWNDNGATNVAQNNGVDIMEGMGAAMLIVLGGFIVFYELDLFYTVYYFFVKPKTIAKSMLNILSNVSLLAQFWVVRIARAVSIREETNLAIVLFFAYVVLRSVYLIVSTRNLAQ